MKLWQKLLEFFELGEIKEAPQTLAGGYLHPVWKITTTAGKFAVKSFDLNYYDLKKIFESEKIARHFKAKQLPVTTAITKNDSWYLKIATTAFMVFPWIEGKVLASRPVNEMQARCIGKIVAQFHCMQPSPILSADPWPAYQKIQWPNVISPRHLFLLQRAEDICLPALSELGNCFLISHRDIYQNNVVWPDVEMPIIIDWESAGLIHPLVELFGVALNWAGLTARQFDKTIFDILIASYWQEYQHTFPDTYQPITATVINASMVSWLKWIDFNYKRILNLFPCNESQKKSALAEIDLSLYVLEKLTQF